MKASMVYLTSFKRHCSPCLEVGVGKVCGSVWAGCEVVRQGRGEGWEGGNEERPWRWTQHVTNRKCPSLDSAAVCSATPFEWIMLG